MNFRVSSHKKDDRKNRIYRRTGHIRVGITDQEAALKATGHSYDVMDDVVQSAVARAVNEAVPEGYSVKVSNSMYGGRTEITTVLSYRAEKPSLLVSADTIELHGRMLGPVMVEAINEWYAEAMRQAELGQAEDQVKHLANSLRSFAVEKAQKEVGFDERFAALQLEVAEAAKAIALKAGQKWIDEGVEYEGGENEAPAIVEQAVARGAASAGQWVRDHGRGRI